MSSNIIVRVRYKKDVNFQRLVGGWCKYVSKDGADSTPLKDLSSLDDYYKKEFGIYDNTEEQEEYFIWSKDGDITKNEILKNLHSDTPGRMWNLVISFPLDFAFNNGLKTKEDYYIMTKSILPKFLLDNNFDLTNTLWYASLHKDTDNPHLHISFFENEERRKKDTLDKKSLKNLKSYIASYLINDVSYYKDQDYFFLGLDNKIRKSNFTKTEKTLFFTNKFRKELNKDLLNLYELLPKKGRLQYNSKNLDHCRKDIDKIIEKILYHDTIKYDFEKYYNNLEEIQRKQKKLYGNSSQNNYIENKMKRLYAKIGNDILYNFKVYNSTDFLERQKEFLKINILNMNFKSKTPKKKSTVLKYAKELYQLGLLANLSENDLKKLINRWLKNSNINYDTDILFSALENSNNKINFSDFYKSLAHLGYSKERYNNLKSKSFYKNVHFKQFIKKANMLLQNEILKEEQFLAEILEKELQGKEF